jgi:hypothetical protein
LDEPAAADAALSALVGDPLRTIARFLADADRFRMRLANRMMRDHAEPVTAPGISRVTFLCARSLAIYACDELPDFMLEDKMRMLEMAATVGSVALLEELMDARRCGDGGCDYGQVCSAAASHGQLEALVWLRGRHCAWTQSVCMSAVAGRHLDVLRYAHEHGCPWDESTCSMAALGGRLEVLRHLHERGCPWDESTCLKAAAGGQFEVLQYACEHGCPGYCPCEICDDIVIVGISRKLISPSHFKGASPR